MLSQTTSQDSVKCFTYEQARIIFKDLKRLDYCDSITNNQALQIINLKDVLTKDNELLQLKDKRLSEVTKSLNNANLKVKVLKKITLFGTPIAFGTGIFLGILVFK